MRVLKKLFAPLKYLKIYNREKLWVDFWLPLISLCTLLVIILLLPLPLDILSENGLLVEVMSFMEVLAAFYIASLAAIATFPSTNMDEATDGYPLKLKEKTLTRRQFVSYLFGYLAFMSIFLVIFSILSGSLINNIELLFFDLSLIWKVVLLYIPLLVFGFLINQILFITLFGLFYLTEKIHKTSPAFVKNNDEDLPDSFDKK